MRFYGSAMPFPHIQGAFQEYLVAEAEQCVVADGLTAGEAAMAEPLAVALHGVNQAGNLLGARVLVTGSGPIGALTILAARRAGAARGDGRRAHARRDAGPRGLGARDVGAPGAARGVRRF